MWVSRCWLCSEIAELAPVPWSPRDMAEAVSCSCAIDFELGIVAILALCENCVTDPRRRDRIPPRMVATKQWGVLWDDEDNVDEVCELLPPDHELFRRRRGR